VLKHKGGDDGEGDGARGVLDDLLDVLVLQPNDILAIVLDQLVVDEQPVPAR
jgi:hypothetical protein